MKPKKNYNKRDSDRIDSDIASNEAIPPNFKLIEFFFEDKSKTGFSLDRIDFEKGP